LRQQRRTCIAGISLERHNRDRLHGGRSALLRRAEPEVRTGGQEERRKQCAAQGLHQVLAERQPQARAVPWLLGREEAAFSQKCKVSASTSKLGEDLGIEIIR